MALRYDRGSLRPAKRMADGRLRCDGLLTRTGVFEYWTTDGKILREYRSPDEVFSPESLESFEGVTITNDHPGVMVTAENAKQFAVGTLQGAPRRDGSHVLGTMIVFDAEAIATMEGGKRELSCGYDCDVVMGSGMSPDGEPYDARQTNIRGNHVAIVDEGRAGHSACVRMDAAVMVIAGEAQEIKMEEQLKQALADLAAATERADAAQAKVTQFEEAAAAAMSDIDSLKAQIAAQSARADAADAAVTAEKQARTDAADKVSQLVAERVALISAAGKVLEGDLVLRTDREIKVAVVKHVDAYDIAADAHDVYVQGRYDSAIARADKAGAALAGLRVAAEAGRTDRVEVLDEAAITRRARERQDASYQAFATRNDKVSG